MSTKLKKTIGKDIRSTGYLFQWRYIYKPRVFLGFITFGYKIGGVEVTVTSDDGATIINKYEINTDYSGLS